MTKVLFFAFLIVMLVMPQTVFAAAPTPAKKQSAEELKKALKEETRQKDELEKQAKSLEKDLDDTRKQLVKSAADVQKNEKNMQALEKKIEELEKEREIIEDELTKDRKSLSHLVLALQRLSRIPPQAMLTKPETPLATAQGAMLMADIIPALKKQADALQENMARLDAIAVDTQSKKEEILAAGEKLKEEQKNLASLERKKKEIYEQTNKELKDQQATVERIALQAKNLEDLVLRLKKNEEQERTRAKNNPASVAARTHTPLPRPGKAQFPVAGMIATAYNEPDSFGAPSQGISIEGQENGLVVAPMGGIVRFAGYFKNYGNMVIVEHQNNYHSLVAGMEKIDTLVGQSVSAGEPIGKLGTPSTGQKPKLYYELRYNGSPVDPGAKLSS